MEKPTLRAPAFLLLFLFFGDKIQGDGLDVGGEFGVLDTGSIQHLFGGQVQHGVLVFVGQIQNLKKVPAAAGVSEKRISKRIQRDSWSAMKYSLRLAQILERTYLVKQQRQSDWDNILKQYEKHKIGQMPVPPQNSRLVTSGRRGRIY